MAASGLLRSAVRSFCSSLFLSLSLFRFAYKGRTEGLEWDLKSRPNNYPFRSSGRAATGIDSGTFCRRWKLINCVLFYLSVPSASRAISVYVFILQLKVYLFPLTSNVYLFPFPVGPGPQVATF